MALPELPLDCLSGVAGAQSAQSWRVYATLAQVCGPLAAAVQRADPVWRCEYEKRFGCEEASAVPDGDLSPTRQSWLQRFNARHQKEVRFLGGRFGMWSRDPTGKAFAVRLRGGAGFAAFQDGHVREYAVKDGQQAEEVASFRGPSSALCMDATDELVVAGFLSGHLLAWDRDSRSQAFETGDGMGAVSSVAFWDRRLVAAHEKDVRIYDLSRPDPVGSLGVHGSTVACVAVDGPRIFTASQDRHFRLFDARSGLCAVAVRMEDWCLAVEPVKGGPMVRASDKAVKLFDLRAPREPVAQETKHKKLVSGFRADKMRLVSCGLDGLVKVRSLEPREEPVRELPPLCHFADYVLAVDFEATCLMCGTVQGAVEIFQL